MNKKLLFRTFFVLSTASILLTSQVLANDASQHSRESVIKKDITSSNDLNNYLTSLSYNSYNVLTRQGESISNMYNKSASNKNGEFVVIEKIKRTLAQKTSDISINANNSNVIFPGALFKADNYLLENNPTLISLKRSPLTLSVDLPGMNGGDGSLVVNNPTQSAIRDGINTLVDKWFSKYGSYSNIPAKIQYDETTAYSMSQLKAKFGADFEKVGAPLNIDFSAVHKGEKQVQVVNFKQVYFNASVDAPNNPADFLGKDVSPTDLINRGINSQTPPVYVSNVAYGRSMYVKFETTSKSSEVKAAVNAVIKGVDIKPGSEYSNILKNTSVTAVILGGNANGAARVVTGTIDDFKKLIKEGSTFNKENPGVPISYTTNFLKDNQIATIQNNTDYIETKVTSYKNGYLTLNHRGGYVARYYITWDEVSYDSKGNEILTPKTWIDNGYGRTAGFSTTLELKGNVRNLRVRIQECTGLAWEWWRTIYDKSGLPLVRNRTITHWGTTLYPALSEDVKNN
ncbi:thiol-activated cytolysin family protein [Gemella cuniculi]|uniref:thiol-activated cytolysin family protein n=1 Tax=Gemella cuniculi TaxID=150240 RepID=UPI00040AD4BC|nr:thiol-activated cytolysin family protein [Gemella cuniculi]